MSDQPVDIEDLLPGLEKPLWEGTDEDFTAYVRTVFGIPDSITTITITSRGAKGRSAVAIGGQAGAIIFALTPRGRQTEIAPIIAGPLSKNTAVTTSAAASDGGENMRAVASVMTRHLPVAVVEDLLVPAVH